jgi:heme-binding NEAT domain protein
MKRVLAVQQQMVKLAEWKLSAAKQQSAELRADALRLQEFVARGDATSPALSEAAFRRGKSLQVAVARSDHTVQVQINHTDTMKRREKLAEKLVDKVVKEADQAAEKRFLQETIETALARDDASFP